MMILLGARDQSLRDCLVIILVFKLSVLTVAHHEQVSLEFLLLS